MSLTRTGCIQFDPTRDSRAWAQEAFRAGQMVVRDPEMRARHLRHQDTWFVGVDALPNDPSGAVNDVPLQGPWDDVLPAHLPMHAGQVSVIYPGYPQRDPGQSEANHRFRMKRHAAHVDGLLPEGTPPRRFAREFHAYILGIHLNACDAAPTVYWPGSHQIIGAALRHALAGRHPRDVDLTDIYKTTRQQVFDQIEPVAVTGPVGGAFLMHRFTLHGTQPWSSAPPHSDGRMTVFFRPQFSSVTDWLLADDDEDSRPDD